MAFNPLPNLARPGTMQRGHTRNSPILPGRKRRLWLDIAYNGLRVRSGGCSQGTSRAFCCTLDGEVNISILNTWLVSYYTTGCLLVLADQDLLQQHKNSVAFCSLPNLALSCHCWLDRDQAQLILLGLTDLSRHPCTGFHASLVIKS